MSQTENTSGRYDGITFSNTAVESVLRGIRDGSSDELVKSFYAGRPDWQDKTTEQTDDNQKKAAQA